MSSSARDANPPDYHDNTDSLLGELFDEVNNSPPFAHDPEITATSDEPIVADTQPKQFYAARKSPFLLSTIIMAMLVAVGYIVTGLNDGQSNSRAPSKKPEQNFVTTSHVFKPIPTPATTNTKVEREVATSSRIVTSSPVVPPALTPTAAHQSAPAPSKPKTAPRKSVPASRQANLPRAAMTVSAWAVNLIALSNHDAALKEVHNLSAKGFHPELALIKKDNRVFYRVRIGNLPSRKAAKKSRALFKAMPKYSHAWINHYKK